MKNWLFILTFFSICISVFTSCCEKPVQGSVFFNFTYEGENYRLRSVSIENNASTYNELIGKKFVANDYDQDGIIDKILQGDISITNAQKIYEYAISILTEQNKLHSVNPMYHSYIFNNTKYNYEIKSFQPNNIEPFNQFRIVEKEGDISSGFIMGIDQKADGTIDTVVVGNMPLEEIQSLYSNVVENGLQNSEMIKSGNKIIVK